MMFSLLMKLLLATAALGMGSAAWSQAYPSKPVKFLLGSAAGSTPDLMGRLIAQKMTESLGVPVIIDNRAGASGTVASDAVAKSAADGYTLLFADSSAWAINPHLFSKLPYDPLKDFAPVVEIGILPMFLVVKASLPASTVQQLMDYAKKNPGKLTYGSAGNGSIHHISAELFKSKSGTFVTHIPYRGAAQVGTGLMAGEIDMAFMGYTAATQGVSTGKVRIVAVGTSQRLDAFPSLPTLAESGLPGFEAYATAGLLAPANTPADVVKKLRDAAAGAAKSGDLLARFAALGVGLRVGSTAEFGAVIRAEYEKFRKLVKLSGAQVD
jgi:tripartite-type tricarboxylate transporter receptor subunit TctC